METKIITEKQNLRHLQWSHARNSSGTAGTFLKSQDVFAGKKIYYKLSNFDSEKGIIGHECVNEIIVDRLLTLLGVEHLHYQLIHADVEIDGQVYDTWICASEDFKENGESKVALDNYFQVNAAPGISHYDFCVENGWQNYIDTMLAVDYLIMNRDRHGANIEVLRNARKKTIRIAPLFDHGLSFLCSCTSEAEISEFDINKDMPCQNFIGTRSTLENLSLLHSKPYLFDSHLSEDARNVLFEDLDSVLTNEHLDKIWNMLFSRYRYYENFCNS